MLTYHLIVAFDRCGNGYVVGINAQQNTILIDVSVEIEKNPSWSRIENIKTTTNAYECAWALQLFRLKAIS